MKSRAMILFGAGVLVVLTSIVIDFAMPGDSGAEPGCHTIWLGVIPTGGYCGMP